MLTILYIGLLTKSSLVDKNKNKKSKDNNFMALLIFTG